MTTSRTIDLHTWAASGSASTMIIANLPPLSDPQRNRKERRAAEAKARRRSAGK